MRTSLTQRQLELVDWSRLPSGGHDDAVGVVRAWLAHLVAE